MRSFIKDKYTLIYMAPEFDTSIVEVRELSDLERQLYSETDVSSEKESIWQ
jgi:hypothetical protein